MGYEIDDDGNVNNNNNNDNQYDVEETTSTETPVVGPHFDYTGFRNITVLVGSTAYLKCRVKRIGNKTVSWVSCVGAKISLTTKHILGSPPRYPFINRRKVFVHER